jgi:hypothetical protein
MPRWTGVLHAAGEPRAVEVSAASAGLEIFADGDLVERWAYAETRHQSGGVPRFERGETILIVTDENFLDSIRRQDANALDRMTSRHHLSFEDLKSAAKAVLIAMLGAAALVLAVWLIRQR